MDIRKRDSVLALLTCPHYHHWTYNAWKVQMEDKADFLAGSSTFFMISSVDFHK